jgi:hypothetical protein
MSRLTGQAEYCRWQATVCRQKASRETGARAREYAKLARHWAALARKFELAESISGFLQWNAQRLEPPEYFDAH